MTDNSLGLNLEVIELAILAVRPVGLLLLVLVDGVVDFDLERGNDLDSVVVVGVGDGVDELFVLLLLFGFGCSMFENIWDKGF